MIETDIKDTAKKQKIPCPVCGLKLYQNDEKTEFLSSVKPRGKKKKVTVDEEIEKRKKHKKSIRKKKKSKDNLLYK